MGLDTTHDCWHGSYSAFNRFRRELAKSIGINLDAMYGYGGDTPFPNKEDEPLVILLDHSDCDGEIVPVDCLPLANRLEEIASRLPDYGLRAAALQFASGLRRAYANNEPVEFW